MRWNEQNLTKTKQITIDRAYLEKIGKNMKVQELHCEKFTWTELNAKIEMT